MTAPASSDPGALPRTDPDGRHVAPGPAASDCALSLELLSPHIETALIRPAGHLRFPPALERCLEADTGRARARHLIITGLVGLITYDMFVFADYVLAPDVFRTALFVRFGIVTPCALAAIAALFVRLNPEVRELLETAIMLLVSASLAYLVHASHTPNVAELYFPGVMLSMTFAIITARLRFWHAVAYSGIVLAIYAPATLTLRPFSFTNVSIVMLGNTIFTLYANYVLERDTRQSYLLDLRESLRIARLDVDHGKLDTLSRVDPLTGVSNRRDLDSALNTLLAAPERPVALIVFDVDQFKEFNDAYGHPVGDACLRMAAEQIRASLRRRGDMVARIGGDEFVAVLREADADTAAETANRVRRAIEAAGVVEPSTGLERHVTVSAGLAIAEGPATAADLTAVADRALYRAKQLGRNHVSA